MANRIKGITIEIGGDTTKLDKALAGTNKQLYETQKDLKDIERLLKIDPGNTELLAQKQKALSNAAASTAEKYKMVSEAVKNADSALARGTAYQEKYEPLKQKLQEVSKTFDGLRDNKERMDADFAAGTINTETYDAFNKKIAETESELNALKQTKKDLDKEFEGAKISQSQYDALQRELTECADKMDAAKKESDSFNISLEKLSASAGKVSQKAGKIGDTFAPVSKAAAGLAAAALATVPATEELRGDLANLDASARAAGVGVDVARDTMEKFNAVTSEVDSSVEATANLMQVGFTESGLQIAMENLTGAYLRFPDTLKIESLSDSLQETIATGKATGQFAELLDRLGLSADAFSKQLSSVSTEAERQDIALNTLAHSGLADTYNEWMKNNEALADNRTATLEFQQSLANLAEVVQPIVTKVADLATTFINWFSGLDKGAQNLIFTMVGLAFGISPVAKAISGVSGAISNVKKISDIFTSTAGDKVYLTFAKWALIIVAVVGAVALLIALIGVLTGKSNDIERTLGSVSNTVGSMTNIGTGGTRPYGIGNFTSTDMPALASGTVVKPNSPFTAILGDNKQEPEIVSPYSMLKRANVDAMQECGMFSQSQTSTRPVEMSLDGVVFARLLVPYIGKESARRGVQIVEA